MGFILTNKSSFLKKGSYWIIVLIIATCFISRLPQLLSPYLLLDGDECVVGVMAKHFYEAGELPLFFWGQRYGFSLIECLVIVPFYALLGVTTLAVKLGMLSLWAIGVVFLYKSLSVISTRSRLIPLLLVLVYIWHPAWAIWSMKARGGYITAFTLSNISVYILFHSTLYQRKWMPGFIALLVCLIYQAQPFWLSGVLPLVLYRLCRKSSIINLAQFFAVFIFFFCLFYWHKLTIIEFYKPQIHTPDLDELWIRVSRFFQYLYHSFHGNYYFATIQPPNFFQAFLSIVFVVLVCSLFGLAIYLVIMNRKNSGLFILANLYLPLCYCCTLLFDEMHGRYLLPLSGFALMSAQIFLNRVTAERVIKPAACVLVLSGMVALITFWNFEFISSRKATVNNMVAYFRNNNIKYVFSIDYMLPWEILFYSNEDVIVRMPYEVGRYSIYTDKVNNAYLHGQKTALIYGSWEKQIVQTPSYIVDYMYIIVDPPAPILKSYFYF